MNAIAIGLLALVAGLLLAGLIFARARRRSFIDRRIEQQSTPWTKRRTE